MKNSFDTSFIPQQPLLKVEGSLRRKEPVNIALVIALVIFLTSLIVSAGMYFYKGSLDKQIVALQKQLESKEENLNIADIDRYKLIDSRLMVAKKLLQNHVAFSTILTLLEKITAKDIGLTKLSYIIDKSTGVTTLNLGGEAPSYSAVYAQAEAWRSMQPTLRGVKMDMPTLETGTGIANFMATLVIDPSYVNYARSLKNDEVSAPDTTTSVSGSATPSP